MLHSVLYTPRTAGPSDRTNIGVSRDLNDALEGTNLDFSRTAATARFRYGGLKSR